ncbi:MAG: glycosyltransferase, partial [bacterium]
VESEVFFLGFQLDVRSYLAGTDVLLMPSEDESFCVAALEAMSCGAPVVATRVGGLPEVVDDGVCGFLTPVGDFEAQAGHVQRLLTDNTLWSRMSAAARTIAESKFSQRAIIPEYEAVYARLVS